MTKPGKESYKSQTFGCLMNQLQVLRSQEMISISHLHSMNTLIILKIQLADQTQRLQYLTTHLRKKDLHIQIT